MIHNLIFEEAAIKLVAAKISACHILMGHDRKPKTLEEDAKKHI